METVLQEDLVRVADRVGDDSFAEELYRALTNRRWTKDGQEGHVTLSWSRAEAAVNALRSAESHPRLTLAQTGGEGELSDRVAEALGRLGWRSTELNTGRHDDAHAAKPRETPPPKGLGERMSPAQDSGAWERQAHAEADD